MKNIIMEKAYLFAVATVIESKSIQESKKEFNLTRQLIRCSSSVGANITEAQAAESRKDFIHKLKIAHKEALETEYWLNLLMDTQYLSEAKGVELIRSLKEILKLIISIINKAQMNLNK